MSATSDLRLLALFPERMNPQGIGQFVASVLGDGWHVTGAGTPDDDLGALEEADAILVALVEVQAAAIDKAAKLRLIQTPSHGFDHIDIDAAAERGVPVCNVGTSGAEAGTVAEHAMLLMLACARHLVEGHEGIRAGEWPQLTGSSVELQGKTLGIVGLGHIGCEVAKRARAFGMSLVYHDIVPADEEIEQGLRLKQLPLEEVLAQADFVTVHVPLMPATRGLLGESELARMKPGAILVNTSRGAVVDNDALARAADEGRIIAGVDVYEPEPPPADHPLRSASNVVLSPHVAGTTRESVGRIMSA
ncbi:MAG: 2-hydroxyacid dehydrogenase, partial [Actinomycetota bacterium]